MNTDLSKRCRVYRWKMYNLEGRNMGVCELRARSSSTPKRIRANQAKAFNFKMGKLTSKPVN